tara:strand:- start:794 stop:1156 length:363 start_codon:yes stop_codon:yes gene_type:complete
VEHKIGETTYKLSFGFGNIMEIQRLMSEAFMDSDMSALEGLSPEEVENLTIADLGTDSAAVAKSMELMPKALTQCLRGVNGTPLDDPATYVRDDLEVEHGVELFNLIAEQVKRLTPKKVN